MKHLFRACLLTLLALLPWGSATILANTATTAVTIARGSLTISPEFFTVLYNAPPAGTQRTVASSFTVHVTDARGTLAGWEIRASVVATQSPRGGFPIGRQSITGVSIPAATGITPNLSAPSDALLPAIQIIARSAPNSGAGSSTETFNTQLVLANGLPGGQYTATLMLFATEIGTTGSIPAGRGGPIQQQSGPNPAPSSRPGPITQTSGGPNPEPPARPSTSDPPTSGQQSTTITASTVQKGTAQDAPANVAQPATPAGNTRISQPPVSTADTTIATAPGANLPPGDVSEDGASAITLVGMPVGVRNQEQTGSPGSAPQNAAPSNPAPGANPAPIGQRIPAPFSASSYPVIALDRDTLSIVLPFVPALYDPAVSNGVWHMQTTFVAGSANKTATVRFTSTTPIRTNLGRLFSAAVDPVAGTATILIYPFESVPDAPQVTDIGTLIVTIGAGP